jgi:hypothetical protein
VSEEPLPPLPDAACAVARLAKPARRDLDALGRAAAAAA